MSGRSVGEKRGSSYQNLNYNQNEEYYCEYVMMVMVMVTTMVKVDCNLFLISRGGHSKTGNGYDEDQNKGDDDDEGVGDDDDDDVGNDDNDGSAIVTMAVLQWVAIPTLSAMVVIPRLVMGQHSIRMMIRRRWSVMIMRRRMIMNMAIEMMTPMMTMMKEIVEENPASSLPQIQRH